MIFDKLIADLQNNDHRVRKSAVKALGKLNDMKAVGPLIEILKDIDLFIRCQAAMALRELTNQDFGDDYERWNDWWNKNMR